MEIVTFDALTFSKRLGQAGVPAAQAESQAQALAEIFDVNLNALVITQDCDQTGFPNCACAITK